MNYELWIMSASRLSYSFFINHNRFIVYLINGNFCYNIQYILYIVSCSCTTSCIDNLSKTKCFVFSESGCKGTAFFWHDQIFEKVFCIFFVTRWLSATTFSYGQTQLLNSISQNTHPRFSESRCKITAFFRHDQIFMHFFWLFFVTHWLPKYVL